MERDNVLPRDCKRNCPEEASSSHDLDMIDG
jgi:hypothetical protein